LEESGTVVIVGVVANLLIALSKLGAGAISGSASLLAEGMHSVVDTINSGLLLVGRKRHLLPPDETHPFGHGKELYFWTVTVSLMMFAVGGGAAILRGISGVMKPEPLEDPKWSYIVIAVAGVIAGVSCVFAYRKFRKDHQGLGFWDAVEHAKDPLKFMVVFEDGAEVVGLFIAFVVTFLAHKLKLPWLDGVGSILIGVLLGVMAVMLANESRKLLIGERADKRLIRAIVERIGAEPSVKAVHDPRTMHFGPKSIVVAVGVELDPELKAEQAAWAMLRLEQALKAVHPEISYLYLKLKPVRDVV